MRKKICLIATAIAFFAMSAVSFAANTANINVTSEPITFHALCDKAGGVTLSFDHNTTFVAGDQITADLPLNVSLCTDIDFVMGIANSGADPLPYDAGFALPAIGTNDDGPMTGDGTLTNGASGGVAFWVHGSKGSQRIFIDVVADTTGDGNLEVGTDAGYSITFVGGDPGSSKLAINLLDQSAYAAGAASNNWTDNDLTKSVSSDETDYDDISAASQNTLCINVSEYDQEYVKLSFDSKADKFTWVPSDPQVAHVVAAQVIAFAPCTKRVCGDILDPTAGSQGADDTCRVINNEGGIDASGAGYAGIADGYCEGTHRNNRVIIQETSGTPFASGNYQVQLEILVDGVGGDQGAYFAGNIGTATFTNATDACASEESATSQPTILYNAQNESNVYAIDASGTNGDLAFAPTDTDCGIDADNRITKVKTEEISLFNGSDEDFLFVDIPNIVWDRSLFTEGETLSVKVTLLKSPCGTIFSGEWCVGTLGCEEATDVCKEYSRVYPYFGRNGAYVNVFGITNTSASDVTYDVTIYEKDGDIFTASVPVGAHKINAVLLHSLAVTTADNAGGGVFGDEQSYVVVKGSMPFEGIIYVTNATTGQSFSGSPSDETSATVACP